MFGRHVAEKCSVTWQWRKVLCASIELILKVFLYDSFWRHGKVGELRQTVNLFFRVSRFESYCLHQIPLLFS